MSIGVTCKCGKTVKVKNEAAGRKIRCPECGVILNVSTTLIELEGGSDQKPPGDTTCPGCGKPIAPDAVICVNCGHDMRTGKVVGAASDTPKKKKQRSDNPLLARTLINLFGLEITLKTIVTLVVLAGVCMGMWYVLANPAPVKLGRVRSIEVFTAVDGVIHIKSVPGVGSLKKKFDVAIGGDQRVLTLRNDRNGQFRAVRVAMSEPFLKGHKLFDETRLYFETRNIKLSSAQHEIPLAIASYEFTRQPVTAELPSMKIGLLGASGAGGGIDSLIGPSKAPSGFPGNIFPPAMMQCEFDIAPYEKDPTVIIVKVSGSYQGSKEMFSCGGEVTGELALGMVRGGEVKETPYGQLYRQGRLGLGGQTSLCMAAAGKVVFKNKRGLEATCVYRGTRMSYVWNEPYKTFVTTARVWRLRSGVDFSRLAVTVIFATPPEGAGDLTLTIYDQTLVIPEADYR